MGGANGSVDCAQFGTSSGNVGKSAASDD